MSGMSGAAGGLAHRVSAVISLSFTARERIQ